MLVLTRRKDEAIVLGEEITITVLEIDGERVKIGIEAPQATRILRKELLAEVGNVNREATQANIQFLRRLQKPDDRPKD